MNEQDKTTFAPEEIQERFNALPKNLQAVAESQELAHALTRLGNQHAFSEDDTNALQDIVGLIILGFIPRATLKEELGVFGLPEKETEELARELNAMVFDPLKIGASSSLRGDGALNTDVLNFGLDFVSQSSSQEKPLDRDALLAEIEDTPEKEGGDADTSGEQDFIGKKMAAGGSLPRTESEFEEDSGGKDDTQDPTKHSGYEVDPYREPIE